MSNGHQKGFTLVEIVLVLLLLGIVAAVAVPSIRGIMDETRLDEAAQEVENILRYARNLAVQKNTSRLVDCDAVNEKCSLLLGYQSSGNNLLTFDNTKNPPKSDNWGVRNVKVTSGKTVLFQDNTPYGNIPGGDISHVDRMDYTFSGTGEKLKLSYSVYDSDVLGEIVILFNTVKVADAIIDDNDEWTNTKTIDLPSVVTGDVTIRNKLDKKTYVVDFVSSSRLGGVDIVSADFGGIDDVMFNSDGTPYAGGSIVLSYKGRTKTVNVESGSGNISMQ